MNVTIENQPSSIPNSPDLLPLTEGIYAFPGEANLARPWLGVVTTAEGTVLVDSGNGPRHAAALQASLDAVGAPPVTHILLTHHHWDHTWGSGAFPAARVVAHVLTQQHLLIMAGEPWSDEYVTAKGEQFPRGRVVAEWMKQAVPDWTAFRVRAADETFSDRYELALGGFTLTMEHVGGPHEPDQCLVHAQPGNVLFVGDATYGRGPREAWREQGLCKALRGFQDRGAAWVVEGHRPPASRERFAARVAGYCRDELGVPDGQ